MQKILAIDDKKDNLITVSSLLKNLMPECAVITAQSGMEGISKAISEQPDVILLDIKMPDMDGFETCRRLKTESSTRHIPIIMITAIRTDTQSRIKGLSLGADAFISKPIDMSELVSQVKVALRIKKVEDALRNERDFLEQTVAERTRALQKSEAIYRHIYDSIPVGIAKISLEHRIESANNSYCRMLGHVEKELVGKHLSTITHPDDLQENMDKQKRLGQGKIDRYQMEKRFVHPSGHTVWAFLEAKLIRDTHGSPQYTMESIVDITESRHIKETLRRTSENLQSILDFSPLLIGEISMDGCYLNANSATAALFDLTPPELVGKRFDDLLPASTTKIFMERIAQVTASGKSITVEDQIDFSEASRHYLTTLFPLFDASGQVRSVGTIAHDITERKLAETERAKLMSAVAHTKEMFVITDLKGNIEYVNPSFEQITGYTSKEVIGLNPRMLKSGKQNNAFYENLWQTILSGQTWQGRMTNKKKDGDFYIEDTIISPVFDPAGKIKNFVAVKRDLTHILRMEEKLQQSQKMESIGTLAGGIAHDFNNILFPIIGHTELLLDDIPDDGPVRESLKEIHTGGLRARDLVQQILAFSRQEKNERTIMKMQPIIKEAIKLIRATIPATISIRQNIQSDCGPIQADPTQIHQMIMNLATNAFHAMEENGGQLTVSLKKITWGESDLIPLDMNPGLYNCLTVADTGMGIGRDIINKIFDPFFTTKEKGKGTGMGLSVVHGIVKSMNGTIQVYSEPGTGTEFQVYLPAAGSVFENHETVTNTPVPGGMEKILLVDDEEAIVFIEKQMIERLAYHVTYRTSSIEALEAFKANPDQFDLVITDMAMPKMSGDKLAVELIKIRPDIPILLCTGFSETLTDEKIQSLGIKGLLMKPVVIKDLTRKIREMLDEGTDQTGDIYRSAQEQRI